MAEPDWQSFNAAQLLALGDALTTHAWHERLKTVQLDLWESLAEELTERNEAQAVVVPGWREQIEQRRHAENELAKWEKVG